MNLYESLTIARACSPSALRSHTFHIVDREDGARRRPLVPLVLSGTTVFYNASQVHTMSGDATVGIDSWCVDDDRGTFTFMGAHAKALAACPSAETR